MAFYGCTGLNAEGALDLSASINITVDVDDEGNETVAIGEFVFAGINKDNIIVPEDADSAIAKYVAAMKAADEAETGADAE
jgi:hypothetical protein